MNAIMKREFAAYFTHPVGYVFIGIILFLASGDFVFNVFWSGTTNMSVVLADMFNAMFLLVPLLTMRLVSEEKKHKTEQLLYTSPITTLDIVMGKFLGAFLLYVVSTAIVFLYQIMLSFYAAVDWGTMLSGYFGLLLVGGFLISIGLVVSSLTESQAVAAIAGLAVSVIINEISGWTTSTDSLQKAVGTWMSPVDRFASFFNGYVSLSDLFFFLFTTASFLFIAVRIIDRKRYI